FFQRQHFHFGAGRLGRYVHSFTRTEGVGYAFAGFLRRFFHGFDFQQTGQGELTDAALLNVAFNNGRQLIHDRVHIFTGQAGHFGNFCNHLSFAVFGGDGGGFAGRGFYRRGFGSRRFTCRRRLGGSGFSSWSLAGSRGVGGSGFGSRFLRCSHDVILVIVVSAGGFSGA